MSGQPYTSRGRDALLLDLNPAQQEAVTHGDGPLLVIAGAGTGKTRVLTYRVAWLVAGGLPPRSVVAITFTNKAADVMKERITRVSGARGTWAGTFHAFSARLLRRHGHEIGISPDYTILDREDQRRLLRDLIKDLGLDREFTRPAEVAAMISHLKNRGGGRAPIDLTSPDVEAGFTRLKETYAARLKAASLLDFDDLLGEAHRLLNEVEAVGDRYRRQLAHVLVDEYQDTNLVQSSLLGLLLGPLQNLTVVGDPDQSIYRWRGAAVRNILEFEQEYPGARRVVLEQNYRSTKSILAAAESVIARNVLRHAKRLRTENPDGARVRWVHRLSVDDEAAAVVSILEEWHEAGLERGEMAVFYRINALSRALELELRARDVPYVVVAGLEFFQRREVKDVLAYARLVENPADDSAFLRVVNVPRRGVGAASLTKIRRAALAGQMSCFDACRQGVEGVSGRARKGLDALMRLVDDVRREPRAPVAPLLERLVERSDYRVWLAKEDDTVESSRLENLDELLAFAYGLDEKEEGDLRAFLERTALVSDQDALEEKRSRVSLMTVHAAKGLEFDGVVIVSAEDGLFPHARSADDPEGLEEERRLFYVAMTRARKRLAISHAEQRFDWRGEADRLPSPYLDDIPSNLVDRDWSEGDWAEDETMVRDVGLYLTPGDRVRHPYFGEGQLVECRDGGRGPGSRRFRGISGRRQLLLSHARLERLA